MEKATARPEETPLVSRPTTDIESELIDLTKVTLADLAAYDDRDLAPAMRRLLRRIDDPKSITTSYHPQRID